MSLLCMLMADAYYGCNPRCIACELAARKSAVAGMMCQTWYCCAQESDLKQIFEPFGPVDYISLQHDAGGRSQGFGFVQCAPFAPAHHLLSA